VEILSLLVLHPGEKFYLREIGRRTGLDVNPIKKELDNLENMGIVSSTVNGNRRYISVNEKCGIYPEIKNLVFKTVALGNTLRSHLTDLKGVKDAFIYGSFAKNTEVRNSDIDLFIIGDVNGRDLQAVVSKAKASIGREINSSNFQIEEIRKRLKNNDHFIKDVMSGKKIFLIGKEDDLRRSLRRR
jgi:predicted nucleotidyltransferase